MHTRSKECCHLCATREHFLPVSCDAVRDESGVYWLLLLVRHDET